MTDFTAYRIHEREGAVQAGFERLTLDDLQPGEVVIQAHYSSVNYKDALAATGRGRILRRFPLVGGIAILIALRIQVVFDLMVDANILGLAAIIVPFILGVYWKKANRAGALAGMFSGLAVWIITMQLWPALPADFMGLAASLLVMLVVTPLTQRVDPPRPLTDSDGNPVEV